MFGQYATLFIRILDMFIAFLGCFSLSQTKLMLFTPLLFLCSLLFLGFKDLTFKIISVAEQGPRAIWIISANGAVSNVRLRRPDTDEGSITLEVCHSFNFKTYIVGGVCECVFYIFA